MSKLTKQTINMLEMLPETEQILANKLIKRLVLAWDSDFTKLTASEKAILKEAKRDLINNDCMFHEDINWN